MSSQNPLDMIDRVAHGLDDLCERVVFIGGAITSLYSKDSAVQTIRPTDDVDGVIEVADRSEYSDLEREIRQHGFRHDVRPNAPICRWIYKSITVDIMPTDPGILGFSNRWFKEAIMHSTTAELPSGRTISIFTLPYFIASKLEAFKGRGEKNFHFSSDIEDIIRVLDSQVDLKHLLAAPDSVRQYIKDEFSLLVINEQFLESVQAHIGYRQTSADRARRIISFLRDTEHEEF